MLEYLVEFKLFWGKKLIRHDVIDVRGRNHFDAVSKAKEKALLANKRATFELVAVVLV